MEYGNFSPDKVREDYWREMNLLSEIMENINKRLEMERKLEALFSEISQYSRGEKVLGTLQNKNASNEISKNIGDIPKDESLYIPSELSEIENIMKYNERNIQKAITWILGNMTMTNRS